MAAAKLADLARPRPLEQCCRVPALDGLLWAGERVKLESEVYGEVVCFTTDLWTGHMEHQTLDQYEPP